MKKIHRKVLALHVRKFDIIIKQTRHVTKAEYGIRDYNKYHAAFPNGLNPNAVTLNCKHLSPSKKAAIIRQEIRESMGAELSAVFTFKDKCFEVVTGIDPRERRKLWNS